MTHEQVPVKVNQRCDVGILPLVEALSLDPRVITLDSCQEAQMCPLASVSFTTDGDWNDLAALAASLAAALSGSEWNFVMLEWYSGDGQPRVTLRCPLAHIAAIAAKVRAWAEAPQ